MARRWSDSRRREQLPSDWAERRLRTAQRAGWQCEALSQIEEDGRIYGQGVRCWRKGTECDHAGDRWDHDDLQWLCRHHHAKKTQEESLAVRRRLGPKKRPEEPHPGRL